MARTRTYYIAADPVVWHYAPSGRDVIGNTLLPPVAAPQLGRAYHKVIYVEYTDATFLHIKARRPGQAYLGLLGPPIFAEVGDTVDVVFKNNGPLPMGVHVHGLLYKKNSEGAPYADGTSGQDKADDAVLPGHTYRYVWQVPDRAGPGPGDSSSVLWMYHSHTDEVRDINTGVVGPIVVTARGMAKADGSPKDVDAQFFTMFSEMDESQSRLLPQNLADVRVNPLHVKGSEPAFQGANQFFTINGYIFGNMPMMTMHVGQRVRWYVMATMSDFDFHSPSWHGETVLFNGHRTDQVELAPMSMAVADMVPDNPGVWPYHCHVNVHLEAGMEARYHVLP